MRSGIQLGLRIVVIGSWHQAVQASQRDSTKRGDYLKMIVPITLDGAVTIAYVINSEDFIRVRERERNSA